MNRPLRARLTRTVAAIAAVVLATPASAQLCNPAAPLSATVLRARRPARLRHQHEIRLGRFVMSTGLAG